MKPTSFMIDQRRGQAKARGWSGASIAGTDTIYGIPLAGTLADGQVWVYDAATDTFVPGYIEDLGTAETDASLVLHPDGAGGVAWGAAATLDVQEDGVDVVNPASAIDAGHGLAASDEGSGVAGLAVVESELTGLLHSLGGGEAGVDTIGAAGASRTLDLSLANVFDLTLTANLTLALSNPTESGVEGLWILICRQGGSGGYTLTLPASVKWQASDGTAIGSAPTLYTAVGAVDVIVLTTLDGGTTYGAANESHPAVGTVTSVAMTVPAEFSVAGSPITSSGTLAISKANENANRVWAGPTSGSAAQPTFRALVTADLPAFTEAQIYGVGGHWEILMDPATSSPPVPLTTPDGTDWVYGWVSDGG